MSSHSNEHIANKNFTRLQDKMMRLIAAHESLYPDPLDKIESMEELAPLIECDSELGDCVTSDPYDEIVEVCAETIRSLMRRDDHLMCVTRELNKRVGNLCAEVNSMMQGSCCGDLGDEAIVCSMNPVVWCRSGEGLVLSQIDNNFIEEWLDLGACDCPRAKFEGTDSLINFGSVAAWGGSGNPIFDHTWRMTVGTKGTRRGLLTVNVGTSGVDRGGYGFAINENDQFCIVYGITSGLSFIPMGADPVINADENAAITVRVTSDGTDHVVYIDGEEIGRVVGALNLGASLGESYIGFSYGTSTAELLYHSGMIWDVNISINGSPESSYIGSGNRLEDWQDQIGSANPLAIQKVSRLVSIGDGFRYDNSLDQPTKYLTTNMPTVGIDTKGRKCPKFDGDDDWLQCIAGIDISQPNIVAVVFKPEVTIDEDSAIVDGFDGFQHSIGFQEDGKIWYENSWRAVTDESVQVGDNYIVIAAFDGNNSKIWVNGLLVHEEQVGEIGLKGLTIGASSGPRQGYFDQGFAGIAGQDQSFFSGTICEVIVIHDPFDIIEGVKAVSNYLADRHYTTITYYKTTDGFLYLQPDGESLYYFAE